MFNFLGKKKKDDGFYAQLDENGNNPAAKTKSKSVAVAEKTPASVVSEPEKQPPQEIAEQQAPTAEPQAPTAEPQAPIAEKKSSKKKSSKKKSTKKAKTTKTQTAPAAAEQPQGPPAKIREPIPSNPEIPNFSTNYLIAPRKSRRRPGPSLKGFKEMASQVKIPRR